MPEDVMGGLKSALDLTWHENVTKVSSFSTINVLSQLLCISLIYTFHLKWSNT